jgi:superfamily II DNA or RNA helicase
MKTKRDLRQEEVLQNWISKGAKGIILAATGFGKTRVGEMAIRRCLEKDPSRVVHVVVPQKLIKNQWDEIIILNNWSTVSCSVINGYIRKKDRKCDFLLVDELHRASNEEAVKFKTAILCTKFRFFLGLSALLSKEQESFLSGIGINVVDKVDIIEAVENEYVSKHKVFFLVFGYDFKYMQYLMSEAGALERRRFEQQRAMSPGTVFGMLSKAFAAMRNRKVFLQKTTSKLQAVKELRKTVFVGKKIITFGQYTDFADSITEMFDDSLSYHSNISSAVINGKKVSKKKVLSMSMDKFSKGEIKMLNTAKAVNEGVDIPEVDGGIVTSYTGNPLTMLQILGRQIRFTEGKEAIMVVLYMRVKDKNKKTQEQKWLEQASKSITPPIWCNSVEEILNHLKCTTT